MASASAGASRSTARMSRTASTAYSVMCAHLRRNRSQSPRPVPRLGIEESAKITAAQRTTGNQFVSARDACTPTMLDSADTKASGWGTPVQIRDGPAAVRGDASAPERHWPSGWEGGAGGSPESEDLPFACQLEPL